MTLQYVRDCKNIDQLKPAIFYLCDNMQGMDWGSFNAYRSLISSCDAVNEIAEHYQVFGYE